MKKIKLIILIMLLGVQTSCMRWLSEKNLGCPLGYSGNCFSDAENDISNDLIVPIDAPAVCKEIGKLYYKAWANAYQGERKRGTLNKTAYQDTIPLSGGMLYPAIAFVDIFSRLYEEGRKEIKLELVKKTYDEKGCPPLVTRAQMQKDLEEKYKKTSSNQ